MEKVWSQDPYNPDFANGITFAQFVEVGRRTLDSMPKQRPEETFADWVDRVGSTDWGDIKYPDARGN